MGFWKDLKKAFARDCFIFLCGMLFAGIICGGLYYLQSRHYRQYVSELGAEIAEAREEVASVRAELTERESELRAVHTRLEANKSEIGRIKSELGECRESAESGLREVGSIRDASSQIRRQCKVLADYYNSVVSVYDSIDSGDGD